MVSGLQNSKRLQNNQETGNSLLWLSHQSGHYHAGEHLPSASEGSGLHHHDEGRERSHLPLYVQQAAEGGHGSHVNHGDFSVSSDLSNGLPLGFWSCP